MQIMWNLGVHGTLEGLKVQNSSVARGRLSYTFLLERPSRMGSAARVGKSDTLNSKKLLTMTEYLSITQKSIIIDFTCINLG